MKNTTRLHLLHICIAWLNSWCWCWFRATASEWTALCVQELSTPSTSVCHLWLIRVPFANRVHKLKINGRKRQPSGGKALVKQEGLLLLWSWNNQEDSLFQLTLVSGQARGTDCKHMWLHPVLCHPQCPSNPASTTQVTTRLENCSSSPSSLFFAIFREIWITTYSPHLLFLMNAKLF